MNDGKNIEQENKVLKSVFKRVVESYTHGTLTQYGLSEEAALDIVSNLTGLPKEKLVELKKARDDKNLESLEDINNTLKNVL